LRPIRILIATHSPLSKQFGAGQVAINLAEAFREQGHNVTLWSPHPMLNLRWWLNFQYIPLMRTKLDKFIDTQDPFDIIDCCSFLITPKVIKSALVVSRSVQPDILYILSNLLNPTNFKETILVPVNLFFRLVDISLVLQGWAKANYILCLGSLELEWMQRWFPWWRTKLLRYVNAISREEQDKLTRIRLNRAKIDSKRIKFLWIGRWVPHKGINTLIKFIRQRMFSNPHDTFTIVGCGSKPESSSLLSKLVQSGKVKIIPSFERNELYSLLNSHDIGLFTSKVEGWGLVLNEMLESGMPVFATRAGGVVDLKDFCKHLHQLSHISFLDLEQLTGNELSKNYYEFFTWDSIANSYASTIFTELSKKN
jgi:glycosyltransferase involved in cell wall biosynthesis